MKNEDLKVGGGNPGTLQALQSSCECLRLAGQGVCKCRLHARRRSACSESNWLRNRSAPGTWARSPRINLQTLPVLGTVRERNRAQERSGGATEVSRTVTRLRLPGRLGSRRVAHRRDQVCRSHPSNSHRADADIRQAVQFATRIDHQLQRPQAQGRHSKRNTKSVRRG